MPSSSRAFVQSAAEVLEEVDVLGEVPVTEELVMDAGTPGCAESVGELAVVEEAGHRRGEGIEVVGIVEQQAVALVNDLVLDPADAAGDQSAAPSTSLR